MELVLKFVMLFFHLVISCVLMYYVGDYMSKPINIGFILLGGLIYSGIMISILYHIYHFISSLKKHTKL